MNLVLGWFFSAGPAAREPLGEPHEITYRAGDETDVAAIAPDADVVGAWLALLASGDRSGHVEPPERPEPDDLGLLAQLTIHGHGRGQLGSCEPDA